jgi:alkylation response protein AidB-like acyl-CoA dehydrogenase
VAESKGLREELEAWVADNWSLEITVREWWKRLYEAGLSKPDWPAPFGRGYNRTETQMVGEVLAAHRCVAAPRGGLGVNLFGPTILRHGTAAQQEKYLPALLRGEEAWCQLFSEPNAGSDLAGVGTSAVKDGDEWIINGQKVWNSSATVADRGMLMARTDPDQPKHAGISYFMLDMLQPGVEARLLKQMDGEANFCEVFFTDARVADSDIVDARGKGWMVAQTTLQNERSMVGARMPRGLVNLPSGSKADILDEVIGDVIKRQPEESSRTFTGMAIPARKLIQMAQERGVNTDPNVRQTLVRYYTLTQISRYMQQRMKNPADAAALASLTKLATAQVCQTSREVGFTVLGSDTMLWGDDAPYGGDVVTVGLASFGTSIGGGTNEIQRNVIGERTLGLPREPQVDKDVPYRDLKVGTQRSGNGR